MGAQLVDFAVTTIFARECMEGAIIIGQYRTIILRGRIGALAPGVTQPQALSAVTAASAVAAAVALLVIAGTAIPLVILSSSLNETTSEVIEGVSKIVASVSLLLLSLKLPKMLGVYGSSKKHGPDEGLTLRSIRFNVAWNIWREVAECGVFLIPFFLNGNGLMKIPLSAVIGSAVGLLLGGGIYLVNKSFTNRRHLCIFVVLLVVALSAGLFTGGSHLLEVQFDTTKEVWRIQGKFWGVDRLPMTILKPFGYGNSRTVLEIVCYWSWLLLCALLHFRKFRISPRVGTAPDDDGEIGGEGARDFSTLDLGDDHSDAEEMSSHEDALTEQFSGEVCLEEGAVMQMESAGERVL